LELGGLVDMLVINVNECGAVSVYLWLGLLMMYKFFLHMVAEDTRFFLPLYFLLAAWLSNCSYCLFFWHYVHLETLELNVSWSSVVKVDMETD
jgi:hypothetical protein